jgi:hypothetical protein
MASLLAIGVPPPIEGGKFYYFSFTTIDFHQFSVQVFFNR